MKARSRAFSLSVSLSLYALTVCTYCWWTQARAQASYSLSNHWRPVGLDAPVFRWDEVPLQGPEWRVELYGGRTQDSLQPVIDYLYGTREIVSLAAPGYFRSSSGFLSIIDAPMGGWAWLRVKVWDVGLGATFEEATARGMGGYGQSALLYAQGGVPVPPS
jgi:hypothetical protein